MKILDDLSEIKTSQKGADGNKAIGVLFGSSSDNIKTL